MRTRWTFHFMTLLSCLMFLLMAGCGEDEDMENDKRLIGTWNWTDDVLGITAKMKLDNNGKVTVSSLGITVSGTWFTDGNTLIIITKFSGETFTEKYTYSVKGKTLILKPEDGEEQEWEKV